MYRVENEENENEFVRVVKRTNGGKERKREVFFDNGAREIDL